MIKFRSFFASFKAAGNGIAETVCTERNLRFHLVAALFVEYFARYFMLSTAEECILVLVISFVIGMEYLNTAVEAAVDLSCTEQNLLAKKSKDAAAAGVLVAALGAVIIGIKLFWKPDILGQIIKTFLTTPLKLFLLILAITAGIWFVFFWKEPQKQSKQGNH